MIEAEFREEPPDGKKCYVCKEEIYSAKMHVFYLITLDLETPILRLCDPCYMLEQKEGK